MSEKHFQLSRGSGLVADDGILCSQKSLSYTQKFLTVGAWRVHIVRTSTAQFFFCICEMMSLETHTSSPGREDRKSVV